MVGIRYTILYNNNGNNKFNNMNPNYTTLNRDIGLIQRSNNGWDLWFDNGDTVRAEDFHSLQVGIIIACLTSWNYMNRYGNPTYKEFGNKSYTLLKANKSAMVAYRIEQYFMECLKRMRRVYEVVSLTVSEVPREPHKYFVEFEVISISNQLVDGSFIISTDEDKSVSYIDYELYMPYASNKTPLRMDVWLKNEYGGGLEGEILYMFVQEGDSEPIRKIVGKTDRIGYLRVEYEPVDENALNNVHFVFRGNSRYNPCISQYKPFATEQIRYDIQFLDDDIVDAPKFVDLHIKLRKQSLVTDEYTNIPNVGVVIIGSDDSFYETTTDVFGEATVRVKVNKNTTFATLYGDVSDEINVSRAKITPTLKLKTQRISGGSGGRMGLIVQLYDEDRPITENIDGLRVTFKQDNQIIKESDVIIFTDIAMATTSVPISQYTDWTAELNGNDYYYGTSETYEE